MPISKTTTRKRTPASRAGAGATRLKNYLSETPVEESLEIIRRTLAANGARRITFDNDAAGQPCAIEFSLQVRDERLTFRLPMRMEGVERLVAESHRDAGRRLAGDRLRAQAQMTGWANIRDWCTAQMALVKTGMVKPEEVFLPYLLLEGAATPVTYFEAFEQHRLALPERRSHVTISEEQ